MSFDLFLILQLVFLKVLVMLYLVLLCHIMGLPVTDDINFDATEKEF